MVIPLATRDYAHPTPGSAPPKDPETKMSPIEVRGQPRRHQARSGVLVVDHEHRIHLATTAACDLVERSVADLHQAPLSRLFPRHRLPGVVAAAITPGDPDRRISDVVTDLVTRHGRHRRVVASIVAASSQSEAGAMVYLNAVDPETVTPAEDLYRDLLDIVIDGGDHGDVAHGVCARLATVPKFLGTTLVRRTEDSRHGEVVAATGCLAGEIGRWLPLTDPRWRRMWRSGTPMRIVGTPTPISERLADPTIDSIWLAPLRIGAEIEGVVTAVGRSQDRPPRTLTAYIAEVAAAASVALETSETSTGRSTAVLIADHERIARDLHDVVIGRVIATAMHLEAVLGQIDGDLRRRLDTAIDELDVVAREIRSTVFRLHRSDGHTGLADEIRDLTARIGSGFGLRAHCEIRGRDQDLPAGLRSTLLAVLRETLSNAGRHARADSVRVEVDLDDIVQVRVIDDGTGLEAARHEGDRDNDALAASQYSGLSANRSGARPRESISANGHGKADGYLLTNRDAGPDRTDCLDRAPHHTERTHHGNGLRNLRDRARELGGDCYLLPRHPHGTEVRWQVPRPAGAHRRVD